MNSVSTQPYLRPAFGWRQKDEDFAHLHLTKTTFRIAHNPHIPDRLDPRDWLRARKPSGLNSSCGDALATCLEVVHWLKSRGEVVRLSRMCSYLVSQKMDGLIGSDVGATVAGSIKASKVFGVCRERVMRTRKRYSDGLTLAAIDDAAAFRAVSHSMLGTYNDVFHYLAQGLGAVLLGTAWRTSLACAGTRVDEIAGRPLGAHVLAIVGYTDEITDGDDRPYLIAVDSGNADWGNNGFSLIAPRLFDVWGRDRASLMIGLSDMFFYRKRGIPESAKC